MYLYARTYANLPLGDVPTVYGQHGLDLGKNNPDGAAWAAYRPNLTTYQVPSEITKAIGGGATGGATLRAPKGGFKERDLEVQFEREYSPTPRSPTRYIPPATGAPQPSEEKSGNGAVIGGAVGGVAAVLLVGAIAFIVFYRRRKAKLAQPAHDHKDRPVSELPSGSTEHLKSPSAYTPLQSNLSPYGSSPPDGTWNGWHHPAPAYPGQPPNGFASDSKHASILQEPQELPAIEPQELPASPYNPGFDKKKNAAGSSSQPPADIHPALKSSATAESAGLPPSPRRNPPGESSKKKPEKPEQRKTIIKHV